MYFLGLCLIALGILLLGLLIWLILSEDDDDNDDSGSGGTNPDIASTVLITQAVILTTIL